MFFCVLSLRMWFVGEGLCVLPFERPVFRSFYFVVGLIVKNINIFVKKTFVLQGNGDIMKQNII